MQNVSDIFLRGRAAQISMMQLATYNAAFMGNAAMQTVRLSVNAPLAFWSAIGRADFSDAGVVDAPAPKTAPKPKIAAKPAPAKKSKAAPKPTVEAVVAEAASAAPKAAAKPVANPKPAAAPKPEAGKPKAAAKPKAAPKAKTAKAPKAAAAPVEVAPATPATSFLLDAPRGGKADPLIELKGVGEKLATALNDFGIFHFDQIAALTPDQIEWLDENQKGFRMVLGRYDLIEQAKARA